MCRLILLSNTKNSSINKSLARNKIYIKVKRPQALCGRHDHRAARKDRGTDSSFSIVCFSGKTLSVHSMVKVILCGDTLPYTDSGLKPTMNQVA